MGQASVDDGHNEGLSRDGRAQLVRPRREKRVPVTDAPVAFAIVRTTGRAENGWPQPGRVALSLQ